MDYSKQKEKAIILKTKNRINQVYIEHITHIICESYLCTIFLNDGSTKSYVRLLREFESELEEYGFLRISHNTLINTKYFCTMKTRGHKRKIILKQGTELIVSRRKWPIVKNKLEI